MRSALLALTATLAALLFADASHAGCRTVGASFRAGFGGYGYHAAVVQFVPSYTYAVPVPVQVPVPAPAPAPVPPLIVAPADATPCPAPAVGFAVPSYSFPPSFSTYGGFSTFDVGVYHGRGVRFVGRRAFGGRGFNASAEPGTGAVGLVRGAVRTVGNVVRDVIGR